MNAECILHSLAPPNRRFSVDNTRQLLYTKGCLTDERDEEQQMRLRWFARTSTFILLPLFSFVSTNFAQTRGADSYIQLLNHKEAAQRLYGVYALGVIGDAQAVQPLIKILKDPEPYVRIAAVDALGKIADESSLSTLTALLEDDDALIRAHAAEAVSKILPAQGKKYQIRRYEKDLVDAEQQVRSQAFTALTSLVPEKSVTYRRQFATANLSEADALTRLNAIQTLAEIGDGDTADALIPMLKDANALVRASAINALGAIAGRVGIGTLEIPVDTLIGVLSGEDAQGQTSASELLVRIGPDAVPGLVTALETPDGTVNTVVLNTLTRIGSLATDALVNALAAENAATRAAAAMALGQIHPERARDYQVQRALNDLADANAALRAQAATQLGELESTAAVAPLVKALADQDSRVQQSAALALSRIGDPSIDPLVPMLGHGNPSVRWHATFALKEIAGRLEANARLVAAIEPLISNLKSADSALRDMTAEALRRIGKPASEKVATLLTAEDATTRATAVSLLATLEPDMAYAYERIRYVKDLKDSNSGVRAVAAQALGTVGNAETTDALVAALGDTDARVRRNATNALVQLGESAIEPLTNALTDASPTTRWHALVALGGIAQRLEDTISMQPAVDNIAALLRDTNRAVRSAAIGALAQIGRPAADALITMLGDIDTGVRSGATKALGQMGDTVTEPLVATLSNPKSAVRQGAAAALGMISPDRAEWHQVTSYVNDLKDADPIVRIRAAKMLGVLGGTRAVEPLISALADADYRVRLNAADALGGLNDKRAIDALELARKDQVKAVEEAAKNAAERLKRLP